MRFRIKLEPSLAADVMELDHAAYSYDPSVAENRRQYFANGEGYPEMEPWRAGKVTGDLYIAKIE